MSYPPFNPYASFSFGTDFTAAREYLAGLPPLEGGGRVTVQHLLVASLARTYAEFPMANAAVSRGGDIVRYPHVGVTMPVDLGDRSRGETGAVIVEKAETMSLVELAVNARKHVNSERSETPDDPIFARLAPVLERVPTPVLNGLLSTADALTRLPFVEQALRSRFPLTCVVSNVGSSVALPGGTISRAAGFSPPARFISIGSLLGVFPVQDEVLALDGEARVRPVLPCTYVFDHRLFDGVKAGTIMARFIEILGAPGTQFGPDGQTEGPSHVG